MLIRYASFLFVMALTACVPSHLPLPPDESLSRSYEPIRKEFSLPPIGLITKAFVGDTLVVQGVQTMRDSIVLKAPCETNWPRGDGARDAPIRFPEGARLLRVGSTRSVIPVYAAGREAGVTSVLSSPFGFGLAVDDEARVHAIYGFGGLIPEVPGHKAQREREDFHTVSEKDFKQEFIYNGRSKDSLFFTYREFAGDFIRPAFTQNLTYSLELDRVIGFKAHQVEVLEATNREITYRVLRQF